MSDLADSIWETVRLNEAHETLAHQANLVACTTPALKTNLGRAASLATADTEMRAHWVEQTEQHLGIEVESVMALHSQVALFITKTLTLNGALWDEATQALENLNLAQLRGGQPNKTGFTNQQDA